MGTKRVAEEFMRGIWNWALQATVAATEAALRAAKAAAAAAAGEGGAMMAGDGDGVRAARAEQAAAEAAAEAAKLRRDVALKDGALAEMRGRLVERDTVITSSTHGLERQVRGPSSPAPPPASRSRVVCETSKKHPPPCRYLRLACVGEK